MIDVLSELGVNTQPQFWVSVVEIIWINVLLSGDNAIVIALACRGLRLSTGWPVWCSARLSRSAPHRLYQRRRDADVHPLPQDRGRRGAVLDFVEIAGA